MRLCYDTREQCVCSVYYVNGYEDGVRETTTETVGKRDCSRVHGAKKKCKNVKRPSLNIILFTYARANRSGFRDGGSGGG